MPIFEPPAGLIQVAHFILPRVQTWGSKKDAAYKERVRQVAILPPNPDERYDWFVFCIRCVVGESRGKRKRQVPDVENIPKLILDALTRHLYPDDNLHYVRGVQVEAKWGRDEDEMAEVWIYGKAKGDVEVD
ncbi:MAG: RusA family crossover junction endodeoxyribonuclease [Anaerolineae bacterium]|nr:RusA family crossover junction endodeoxyribonuclease [Anaerolineae bacterium]